MKNKTTDKNAIKNQLTATGENSYTSDNNNIPWKRIPPDNLTSLFLKVLDKIISNNPSLKVIYSFEFTRYLNDIIEETLSKNFEQDINKILSDQIKGVLGHGSTLVVSEQARLSNYIKCIRNKEIREDINKFLNEPYVQVILDSEAIKSLSERANAGTKTGNRQKKDVNNIEYTLHDEIHDTIQVLMNQIAEHVHKDQVFFNQLKQYENIDITNQLVKTTEALFDQYVNPLVYKDNYSRFSDLYKQVPGSANCNVKFDLKSANYIHTLLASTRLLNKFFKDEHHNNPKLHIEYKYDHISVNEYASKRGDTRSRLIDLEKEPLSYEEITYKIRELRLNDSRSLLRLM
jgi:hypothetical protein